MGECDQNNFRTKFGGDSLEFPWKNKVESSTTFRNKHLKSRRIVKEDDKYWGVSIYATNIVQCEKKGKSSNGEK